MARSGIIYGDSNTLKSTACKHFSHYIYERTGKCTLLLSMDGGGWAPMQPEIDAGVISAYRCNTQVPLPILRRISQGYWPEDTGETEISRTNLRKVDWQKFGGMVIEGVTSISQAIMRHLADKGIKTGEEATSPFAQRVMVEGVVETEAFAGSSRAHYGFTQNQLYSMISNFSSLPCEYVLWTALESRAEEDDRTLVYGPQVAGKKATALVPSWVGDCIHAQGTSVRKTVQVPDPADAKKLVDSEIVETNVRMYFIKHPDPVTSILYPAKPRVTPEKIPDLMKRYPGGYFEPSLTSGFDDYLKLLDVLGASQKDEVLEWRKKVDERRKQAGAQTGPMQTQPAMAPGPVAVAK
jgi:hypothetical protein